MELRTPMISGQVLKSNASCVTMLKPAGSPMLLHAAQAAVRSAMPVREIARRKLQLA
jgi:hypothetical protein